MNFNHRVIFLKSLTVVFLFWPIWSFAQGTGVLRGNVYDKATKEPVPFANVVVKGTALGSTTDFKGEFTIPKVPEGVYTLVVSIVGYHPTELEGVNVLPDETTSISVAMVLAPVQLSEVQVYGASLRKERITEAPAAVSVLEAKDFKLNGAHNQLPKLLETEPGVDIAQSGLYDFNVNTRGFNSSLNRRLQVLLDGRDLAIAFLGAQEWNGMSVPVEDLGRMELVRGPSSALYGANAFNGVINIQTPRPKEIVGTKVTVGGGERQTLRLDVRHAEASGPWGYKVNAGRVQGNSWSINRKGMRWGEYAGFDILNNEEAELKSASVASTYGSGRVDYDFEDGGSSTAEVGVTQVENEVFVTGIGRVQVPRALKPWARINYSHQSFYVQVWGAGRDSQEPQISLSSGLPLIERSFIGQADVQYRTQLFADNLFLIGGFSLRYQTIGTEGTLMLEDRKDNATGLYAQVEYSPLEKVKLVGAARWDRSTLHETQISPKFAAVWTPLGNHSFRATYNEAFQSPNLSELFLRVLRTATNPNTGTKSYTAFLGNSNLHVERIRGYELGYKGILNNELFITVDGYFNILSNFITDLSPIASGVAVPGDTVKDDLGLQVRRSIWSYDNAGKVEERGFELGINYYFSDAITINTNYAFFEHGVIESAPGVNPDNFLPNAPKHKINGGVTYTSPYGFEIGTRVKYVPSFNWAAGVYKGRVLAYTLLDVSGRYHLTENFDLSINVSNVLDRRHYQIFGGSVMGRRTVASLTATF